MCSETSPRISFSNDLSQEDDLHVEHEFSRRDTMLLDSINSDFEFGICSSLDHEPSLADELFANGMILPVQIQERKTVNDPVQVQELSLLPLPSPSPSTENSKKESSTGIKAINSESKSFWRFKRNSSLNCDIKRSLICSLSLLSRSSSTGSMPNSKQKQNPNPQKQQSNSMAKSVSPSPSSSASTTHVYTLPQKTPLKKNIYSGSISHGNGVRISPVLNLPPLYISKGTANLFGLGSYLCNGKEKKNRK